MVRNKGKICQGWWI